MKLSDHVHAVPIVDNETDLFESLWPLDEGVNYNSYVVVGSEGAAVIDTVHEAFSEEFLEKLGSIVDPEKIRYVVLNHMEPDHSSSVEVILQQAPNAKVVVSQTAAAMFRLPGDVFPVKEGDELSLGDVTLRFHSTPWVHWPETMITYVPEDGVLFTCDLFGAYGAYPNLQAKEWNEYLLEARRYYVTVLSKYAKFVKSAVAKVRSIGPEVIAPGHGIIYKADRLKEMLDLYDSWTSNHREDRVLILYGSMYGSVHDAVHVLVDFLEGEGVEVDALDLSREDWSYAMTFVLGAGAVVIAYPTYDADVFPPVKYFIQTVRDKGLLEGRPIYVIEAHGWSSSEAKARQLLEGLDIRGFYSFSQKQPISVSTLEELAEELARNLE